MPDPLPWMAHPWHRQPPGTANVRTLVKRTFWIALTFVVALAALGLWRATLSLRNSLVSVRLSREVMGTLASVQAVGQRDHEKDLRRAIDQAFAAIDEVEARMSHYRDDSLVSRINRQAGAEPVPLDNWTWQVLSESERYWQLSHGAFDPTCGPLIELWKNGAKQNRLPTEEELAAAKDRTGFDKVQLDPGPPPAIRFAHPDMRIDLGGIAKGYSIDLAVQRLKEAGCVGGMVDIGGDIRVFGRPDDDEHWEIAVQAPFRQRTLLVLSLNDAAVCTSGNYMRFAEIQGHRYSHIIDPRTGRPAKVTPSVTIVGVETTGADALATAVSVLGPEQGIALVRTLPGYEAMIVAGQPDSFQQIQSDGFSTYVHK
jgi:thiamine biosynthesis lipoprotein